MDSSLPAEDRRHRRSISQLIAGNDYVYYTGEGTFNPAMVNDDDVRGNQHNNSDTDDENDEEDDDAKNSRCVPEFQFSLVDSEYDETLAFPDSVTILSNVGDKPVLVERQDTDEEEIDNPNTLSEIPFTTLYGPSVKFNSFQRKVFIPGVEVHVQIIDNERSVTTHLLNPNLYTIQLTHGPFVWTVKKRYKHFNSLHQQLRVFRASLNIPFPMRSHKEKRATLKNAAIQMDEKPNTSFSNKNVVPTISGGPMANTASSTTPDSRSIRKKRKLPRFPNRPESLVTAESLPNRIKQLEEYLYNLLNISLYRSHHETLNFVEVSNVSFVSGLGHKGKEGAVLKRTGSTRPGQVGCNCFGCFQHRCCVRCNYFCSDVLCGKWRNRWFFVKETCFGYMRPTDGTIRAVILFDQGFDVSTGIYQTGMRKGLQILTNNRHIILKCWTKRKAKEWLTYLKQTANVAAREFTYPNPHMSYAPVRNSVQANWFVDGSSYMSAVADALEAATSEIYIADWWLSPEIYMKRPAIDGDYWRLDKILLRKAMEGIRIFVMLYKEVEMALGINSYYSKQRLVNLHENIKVLRHPDHARVGIFLWAHHEKVVVIDQTYAFLGGLDLCYGRWDDFRHRLTDLGSISTASISGSLPKRSFFNDGDSAFGSSKSSRNANTDLQEREKEVILRVLEPGDKLVIPDLIQSENVVDESLKLNTPEMERRNMLGKIKDNAVKRGKELVNRLTLTEGTEKAFDINPKSPGIDAKSLTFSPEELIEGRRGGLEDPTPYQTQVLSDYYGNAKFWFGKDYSNFIIKDLINLDAPFADLVDRTTTPRMPWHDVSIMVVGSSARDVARHFIQRWNATKLEKMRDNYSFPYLMPMSYMNIKVNPNFIKTKPNRVTCQILRSVASWSCGFIEPDLVEESIHDAYVQTITNAQHYIYIENQFFITLQLGVSGASSNVRNQIGETLFKRIVRAHREKKTFRVYVVMPLLPAFEGDVGGQTGNALRAITHWNYASISRGRTAILVRLKELGIDNPHEYISFHSLRNHSQLNNIPITELIYVHSKLLIADDRMVICGSANINDRSMIGKRDSEIAAILTDQEYEDGRMNGTKYPSGVFAGRLRKYLFKEHLGLLEPDPERIPIDVTDPVIDQFWNGTWRRISKRNTEIYDEVFKCIPNDYVKTFASLKKYNEEPPICKTDPEVAVQMVKKIQGFIVNLPTEFLTDEILTPPSTSKEGIIPTAVWT